MCVCASTFAQSFPVLYSDGRLYNNEFVHDSLATKYMSLLPSIDKSTESPQVDKNEKSCALIQVITANDSTIRFSGNIIGDVEYKDGKYHLYLTEKSHLLRIIKDGRPFDVDLYRIGKRYVDIIDGGETYCLCGLDNDEFVSLNPYTELFHSDDAKLLRNFAHEYIEAFNNRDLHKFKDYYDEDKRLVAGNGNALYHLISELDNNGNIGYYAKCFPINYHGTKPHVYGMTVGFYDSDPEVIGYSFLLLDLNDRDRLQTHIATYQTAFEARRDGVFSFDDFFIP